MFQSGGESGVFPPQSSRTNGSHCRGIAELVDRVSVTVVKQVGFSAKIVKNERPVVKENEQYDSKNRHQNRHQNLNLCRIPDGCFGLTYGKH